MDFTLFNPIRQLEAIISNIQPKGKFFLPNFDVEKIPTYQLFFEISSKSFCFWVKDSVTTQIIWVEEYSLSWLDADSSVVDNISFIYSSHEFLKSIKWHSIHIQCDSQSFVQVPLPYFRKEFLQKYLQLAKGQLISNSEQILSQMDEAYGLVHVFSVETELLNWFSQTYPLVEIQYIPVCQILLEIAKAESRLDPAMYVYIKEDAINVVVTNNGKLQLCNRFPTRSTNDVLFYILATLSELSMSPEKAYVKLFGELGADGQLLAILSEYVTNVELGDYQTVRVWEEGQIPKNYIGMKDCFTA